MVQISWTFLIFWNFREKLDCSKFFEKKIFLISKDIPTNWKGQEEVEREQKNIPISSLFGWPSKQKMPNTCVKILWFGVVFVDLESSKISESKNCVVLYSFGPLRIRSSINYGQLCSDIIRCKKTRYQSTCGFSRGIRWFLGRNPFNLNFWRI